MKVIFVVADREHSRLEELTMLLLSTFPGSTVYQHTSLVHASNDVLRLRVDSLLVTGEQSDEAEMMELLQKRKPKLPVLRHTDMEEIGYGHLPRSVVEQRLRSTLQTAKVEGG